MGYSRTFLGRPLPVDGETRAVLYALEMTLAKDWSNIAVDNNCLQ